MFYIFILILYPVTLVIFWNMSDFMHIICMRVIQFTAVSFFHKFGLVIFFFPTLVTGYYLEKMLGEGRHCCLIY